MLGHEPLVKKIALERKKTFISTGMATMDEIDSVVNLFKKEKCPFELMHCNSTYPMPENEANLLFLSWKHWIPSYVRGEVKKKTGVSIP